MIIFDKQYKLIMKNSTSLYCSLLSTANVFFHSTAYYGSSSSNHNVRPLGWPVLGSAFILSRNLLGRCPSSCVPVYGILKYIRVFSPPFSRHVEDNYLILYESFL
jgi:hypothetical protein